MAAQKAIQTIWNQISNAKAKKGSRQPTSKTLALTRNSRGCFWDQQEIMPVQLQVVVATIPTIQHVKSKRTSNGTLSATKKSTRKIRMNVF